MRVSIGADPEFFLRSVTSGELVPAIGLLGGTKERPLQIDGLADGCMMQEDNVMAEFNIPPCPSANNFTAYTEAVINSIIPHASMRYGSALEPVKQCSVVFPNTMLTTPQSMMFGCDPSFDAYTQGSVLAAPAPQELVYKATGQWRFAAGHLHIGYDNKAVPHWVAAMFADLYIGLPALVHFDTQGERRKWYGKPGNYRPKPYGIEYRTVGNGWLWDPVLCALMFDCASNLARFLSGRDRDVSRVYGRIPWASVYTALTTEDRELANALTNELIHDGQVY